MLLVNKLLRHILPSVQILWWRDLMEVDVQCEVANAWLPSQSSHKFDNGKNIQFRRDKRLGDCILQDCST